MTTPYDTGLERNAANHRPLTPLTFLLRAADVFPDRVAVIHGDRRFTWREHALRCRRLAAALVAAEIAPGDTVAMLAPNTPAMLEAHFGVPMAGAVLNNLNIRLDAAGIAFLLEHGEARVLLVDRQFAPVARAALATIARPILVIDIDDPDAGDADPVGTIEYENPSSPRAIRRDAHPLAGQRMGRDRAQLHLRHDRQSQGRGLSPSRRLSQFAEPNSQFRHGRASRLSLDAAALSLQRLVLFLGDRGAGRDACVPEARGADLVYDAIARTGVTHFCAAPTVLGILIDGRPAGWTVPRPIRLMTAGAAPPAAILRQIRAIGFAPLHVYGMTEMHGVTTLCHEQEGVGRIAGGTAHRPHDPPGRALHRAGRADVADPLTLAEVPHDGATLGEVLMRGNMAMKGYLKNRAATQEAFAGGWYHTGDLAVVHADGYIELKDRSKDIIISGGENISSIEVENVLCDHPAVKEAAVVAVPKRAMGRSAVRYRRAEAGVEAGDDGAHRFLPRASGAFQMSAPRHLRAPLARTATGKVQKFKLREQVKGM